jgi:tetratricopeptide (TPR) repeat protein
MMLALAIGHHLQGDYAGARAQCERALALSQASEKLTADLLDVLGSAQRDQGDLEAARISYWQSVEIRQRLFGEESAQVATTLSNLGVVEHRAGRNAEAIDLISPAVLILIKVHGEVHPEVARAAVNLSLAHVAAGNLDVARTLLQHAAATFQSTLGEKHPDFARAIANLANVCLRSGDRHGARRLYARAFRIFSASLGRDHPQTAGVRVQLIEAAEPG